MKKKKHFDVTVCHYGFLISISATVIHILLAVYRDAQVSLSYVHLEPFSDIKDESSCII